MPVEPEPSPAGGRSLLELLVSGQGGLWMTGAGILCLFVGLMLGPGPLVPRVTGADEGSPESSDEATAEESDSKPNSTGEAAEERTRWAPLAATAMAAHGAVSASPDSADGDMTVAPLLWEPENAGSEAEAHEDVELGDAVEEDDDAEPEDEIEEELEDESDEDVEDEDEVDAEDDAELEDEAEEFEDETCDPEIEVRYFSIDRSDCDEFSREAWESSEFDVGDRR